MADTLIVESGSLSASTDGWGGRITSLVIVVAVR